MLRGVEIFTGRVLPLTLSLKKTRNQKFLNDFFFEKTIQKTQFSKNLDHTLFNWVKRQWIFRFLKIVRNSQLFQRSAGQFLMKTQKSNNNCSRVIKPMRKNIVLHIIPFRYCRKHTDLETFKCRSNFVLRPVSL